MRVNAITKAKTRTRIVQAARKLFQKKGFDATTTRDIAAAARIATGTLFNYFSSKEALGMALLAESLQVGRDDYERRRVAVKDLAEDLFLLIASNLRGLEACRHYVAQVIDAALSPFVRSRLCQEADEFRAAHMEYVAECCGRHDCPLDSSYLAAHLYWTLYLGVLGFWSRDVSPHQEDTLALLDQSMRLFVASLSDNHAGLEVSRDA